MPILGIIASGISGNLSSFVTNFTSEGTLPLTSTFGAIANGFTEGKVYWGGGRDYVTNSFYSFYSRTVGSSTWSYENAKPNQGQFRASAYPVGSTNKWIQNGGEYGGALDDVQSMVYNGNWVNETAYPILIKYNGMAVITDTKIGYSIAGDNSGGYVRTVYSYTGSGSWTAQTSYPTDATDIMYHAASLPTKAVICGGRNASGNLSLVYSYTGSGSWTAEANLPSSLSTNNYTATYNYNASVAKVFGMSAGNNDFYYWSGSGAWTLGGTRTATSGGSYAKQLASVSTSLFLMGGDHPGSSGTTFRAVVR